MNIECWQSWHISISSPGIDHLTGDHISRIRGQWSLLSQAWPGGEWSEWKSMPGMKSIKERRVMTTRPVLRGLSELLYQFLRVYRQWCDGARSWVTSVTQLCMHRSARHQPGSGGCRRRRARRKERTVDSGQTGERSQCETVTRPGHTEHTYHLTWSRHREGHTATSDVTWGTIKWPLNSRGRDLKEESCEESESGASELQSRALGSVKNSTFSLCLWPGVARWDWRLEVGNHPIIGRGSSARITPTPQTRASC